jgi:hypothetical protein
MCEKYQYQHSTYRKKIQLFSFWTRITFVALPFLERALRNYKITPIRDLSHRRPLKHSIDFYFYNVCYLSHGQYFLKFLIFPTSIT